ncbi:MAG TPA: serine hydrolase [Pyrinomonadaceae bacterium]|nr:serine hydrolase [Pyrinomonadaceae bacterium]
MTNSLKHNEPHTKKRGRYILFAAAVLLICISQLPMALVIKAQQVAVPDKMSELNRRGEWEQAARLAQTFLISGNPKPLMQRCHAYYELAYAQTRLRRSEEAQDTLTIYDKECGRLAGASSIKREVARLRAQSTAKPELPTTQDDFWLTINPATLGMNVKALELHGDLCTRTGADACLVIHQGKVVQERYYRSYRSPMMAMSSTKSITGILVGMLIEDGKIKSLDEPVCSYVREWCAGQKGKVTLRHLLSMTSGLPRMLSEGVGFVGDKNPFVINLSPTTKPGTAWAYSNEGVQLLSPILDQAAGEPIQDYARKRLFEPLGMKDTRLHLDDKGHAWTYADMETTPRDLGRIGLLMLNKGVWQGKRIVSESWVKQMTTPSQTLNSRYGLLWWLFDNPKGYAAQGYLETNLYVFPEKDLIIVRMQAKPLAPQPPYEDEALSIFNQLTQK